MLKTTVHWKKPDIESLMAQVQAAQSEVLAQGKELTREIIRRNIGTQYVSLAGLRALGHPYSLRGSGRPGGIPLGIVNRQSGGFAASFFVRGPYHTGRRIALQVMQTGAEQALGYMLREGTSRMRGRPWEQHLQREIRRVLEPFIRERMREKLRLRVKRYG